MVLLWGLKMAASLVGPMDEKLVSQKAGLMDAKVAARRAVQSVA